MQRFTLPLAALGLVALFLLHVDPAYACSAGPDFNPLAASDLVVAGYITAQQPLPQTQPNDPQSAPTLHTLAVDHVYKGHPSQEVHFVGYPRTNSCGVTIPAGQYAIVGLSTGSDGTYGVSPLTILFIGAQPTGDEYQRAIDRLAALGATTVGMAPSTDLGTAQHAALPQLPATGTSTLPLHTLGVFAALVLASGYALRSRMRGRA